MSLRLKIVLLLAALSATATAAIGIASYTTTKHALEETVDRSLDAAAASLPDRPGNDDDDDGDGDGPPFGGRPGHDRPRSFEQILVQTLDRSGAILVSPGSGELPVTEADIAVATSDDPLAEARHDASIDGEDFRILTTKYRAGAVQFARSLREGQETLERIEGGDEAGKLGRAFAGMLDALHRSRSEQHQLVQDAGHELRTPLTSLRTNVSVLRRGYGNLAPDQREQLLGDLDSETRELTDLVNELVELATDNRDDELVQPVRLADVAERTAARSRRRFGREVVVEADDSLLDGRPNALERALQNLVDNACKFAPDGPIEVTVHEGIVLVRDHGPGLSPADIPHLFDRFYRSVDMRSKPGSGLGLAIVKSVVDAHEGQVVARNAADGGAELGFVLPLLARSE